MKSNRLNVARLGIPLIAGLGLTILLLLGANWQIVSFSTAQAASTTRYVAPGGNCGKATPCYASLQGAVDASEAGDEIRVAAGTYSGVNNLGGQSQVVYIAKTLTIRGGYSLSNWTTPEPDSQLTILDGANQSRVMTIIGPAEVNLDGLSLTNGRSSNIGGLYMGKYTCSTTAGRGAGGGLCIQNATVTLNEMRIMTNTASLSGGYGGGLFASGAILTMTNSTIQNNKAGTGGSLSYGGGIALLGGQSWIEANLILNNDSNPNYDGQGGGVFATDAVATISNNTIQGNRVRGSTSSGFRLGGAGVGVIGAGVTLSDNYIANNTAIGYVGGGISWMDGLITVTANLVVSNTASWGGGMWAGNAPAIVNNNLIAFNIATGHGSAIYVNTYSPNTASFRHNTISRSSGGDGSAIYVEDYGRVEFVNTILACNTIGVGGGYGTDISLQQTLWDGNLTDTVTLVNEVGHLTGSAAFESDGYHLTEPSAAVDAGIDTGVSSDIDGDPRPRGSAPDLGADESPYYLGPRGEGLNVEKSALPPRLMFASRSMAGEPVYLLQQEYLIRVANNMADTSLSSYLVEDTLPADLDFAAQVHYPPMDFQHNGNTLQWQSLAPLANGDQVWISLVGNATAEDGGKLITNQADLTYSLSGGGDFNQSAEAVSTLPNFPPFIAWPEKGEFCLNRSGELEIRGLSKPGATIQIYEDGGYQISTTADDNGVYMVTYTPAQWNANLTLVLTARDCTGGTCGDSSNAVAVRAPDRGWCPQRSVWEKQMGENLLRWAFRNAAGEMSTHDWEIPGAYGFHDTLLKIYECQVPDPGYSVSNISVEADGVFYEDADGPDSEGMWGFSVHANHSVNVVITASDGTPGGTKTYTSHGNVLIDPDGFIFDVSKGLDVISSTPEGVPLEVGNTIPGVTVTAMVSMPQWGGWVPWPAHLYNNQVNPQVTGEDGYFAFFTPPGHYYLQVDGIEGYQSWRSPVVEVITEIVHVNVPYTPCPQAVADEVKLTPDGPLPASVTIPVGGSVEWVSILDINASTSLALRFMENPILQPRTWDAQDPLNSILGFDGGRLKPGQVYRKQFSKPGTYTYTDGAGHTGTVVVDSYKIFLPFTRRE